MTREEREAISQRISNFYYDSAKKSVKTTVNYFEKQNVPQSTIYYVLRPPPPTHSKIYFRPGKFK